MRVALCGGGDPISARLFARLAEHPELEPHLLAGSEPPASFERGLDAPEALVYLAAARAAPSRSLPVPDLRDAAACLRMAADRNARRAVVVSSAAVHQPSHYHPGMIDEARRTPRRGRPSAIADAWLALEALAHRELAANAACRVTVLRPAPVPTAGGGDFISRLLTGAAAPILPGHDPSLQLLDVEDLCTAVIAALRGDRPGLYHVAPKATIPLRQALRRAGVPALPVPRWLQRPARALLAPAGRAAPLESTEYARYPWTVSGERIRHRLGFAPRFTSAETLGRLRAGKTGGSSTLGPATLEPTTEHEDAYDDFGLDEGYIDALSEGLFPFLHDAYWRIEIRGLEHVPRQGRAVLVGVHRGFQPWDGVMAVHAVRRATGRTPRFLVHPTLVKMPFLASFMTKLGGVIACRENADWVLERDDLLGIFPEGIRGAFTPYRRAYRLGRFGRGEYIRMALANRAPLVPFVTVGSAEIYPILGRVDWRWWKRHSEWPYLPIAPPFPFLPVPQPSKWHTLFLPPIALHERYPPEAARDPAVVATLNAEVKAIMQAALSDLHGRRRHVYWGSLFDATTDQDGC